MDLEGNIHPECEEYMKEFDKKQLNDTYKLMVELE